jgi:hypothetical protein
MSSDVPVPGTGISVVIHGPQSIRVFYQSLDGHINQSRLLDGEWTKERLALRPVCGTPLTSVTYDDGKEVGRSRISGRHGLMSAWVDPPISP